MNSTATQRIVKVRRDYNTWVADETLEDYALRYTPLTFRRWSEFRIANTALGAVSFLALEAIGGAITLSYGFTNAFWAILCVALLIFLTGLPISYYAARYGVDMDLLTRGAGFGYIGSTITSLIYASFTFIFFALEASIMAQAVELYFDLPISWGYVLCSLVIIPLVTHGVTLISRLQLWTQPLWIVLLVLPYVFVLAKEPGALSNLLTFTGRQEDGASFNLLLFGAAATVAISLVAQIGEQVDFLRFLPEKTRANRRRWWTALLLAGPGWIIMGAAKMLGGALLAFLAIQQQVPMEQAMEPTRMYLVGFGYVFSDPAWVLGAVTLFVVVSQVKINITNAYAGSLAWSNFFARLTHSHPGRVVWVVFNVLIAVLLMEVGVFKALEHVLGMYSLVAVAWIGAVVADLVISKPLGLSPPHVEFRRAHLYDVNPVGVGAMLIASVLSMASLLGVFGRMAQAMAPFIALGSAMLAAPLIAWATKGRYYLARTDVLRGGPGQTLQCVICENHFETPDMATCPAYKGTICSLCCSLDARCNDRCKTNARLSDQCMGALNRLLPNAFTRGLKTRVGHYLVVMALTSGVIVTMLGLLYYEELANLTSSAYYSQQALRGVFIKLFSALLLLTGIGVWWLVLTSESRSVALQESERQTNLLLQEIEAHKQTDIELQRAKEAAEAANLAKSRYVTGMSHELRTPLNSILGYAQILQADANMPEHRRDAVGVIRRSGEHLLSLIDGLLDIARIEAGKMRLNSDELPLREFLDQIVRMFRPQAAQKGLAFRFVELGRAPEFVHADEKRLRQILINLLANAVKFTDNGTVTLRFSYARELAEFEIEDSGVGIAPEDIERIFLPFERGAAASQREETGTGLGLAICNMLTHIMGGELSVTSVPGQGSTFRLKIYLTEVRRPGERKKPLGEMAGYLGSRKRILVVDDQASQRRLLDAMLSPLGFDIVQASSGAACLDELARAPFDLVLLDIAMPEQDGWSVCRAIRERGHATLPVIIVSANAFDVSSVRHLEDMPCNDFIVKPVVLAELLAKVRLHTGIDWIPRADDALADKPSRPVKLVPSQPRLRGLLEAASIGHVKGILARLDEIERIDSAYLPFTAELRHLVKRFRLNELSSRLQEMIHHDVDKV
ncbi:hybrid sensor histidine kinase/response regulator [Noviherbaspirillum suwonense]|uniref:histidine kinase n=1 Tax=Noviherbaspirillum suwonense TaxID=1224511 RepID=A0ABY1Q9M9_9BURK|nr:ATP-binding protein [Noviherbaspirillum suwonense]SMP64515.1 Signal transduction histidine kinase [Noviherbaspirillum suwonense]